MTNHSKLPAVILAIAPAAALLTVVLSVLYGTKDISAAEVWRAVVSFDPGDVNHQIILHSRLPRALGALLVGACLAVSGAVMQGITRNDLASPSLLGVSDGSIFAVTLCMIFAPQLSGSGLILVSMTGSLFGAALVFGMGHLLPGGNAPVTLAILGTLTGMFLNGLSDAIAMYYHIPQAVSFWYNARLYQIDPGLIRLSLPFAAAGLALLMVLSRSISALSLGDEVSAGLGQRVRLVRGFTMLAVALLSGISVALAGKIAFVGLIVPHIAKMLGGSDYRRSIPLSGVLGGLFLAFCDILSRFINFPFETPIGVVTALFGVPFFLYLIRRKGGKSHA
ncbi:iron complex transport system permease protein [Paenibacillus forsythiae]|uniref:Iron complex transport system permease protein n=1 Tax=Paenibacillus forsythiae TaxID=365616 RepID=A0ABU3H6R4_9BACL|nr:iron ABC transporter permease [Paenibacillus forsythiae]MDT3426425.1 iron complex transport system permease protein [Paenibacillus forsythiae]